MDHQKSKSSRKTSTALLIISKSLTVRITINWKILQRMGIPDHLTCLLKNLYAGQEATVRTGHGTTDWFQIRKGVCQGCILSPCLFNLYVKYTIRNDITLMAESEEELKSFLIKVKEESEKVGLKLNIQKTKIMASSPITSRQIDGETVETVTNVIFLGSKITANGDCSHEIKMLVPWKKSYNKLRQHIKKQRHYLDSKGPSSQRFGFSSSHVSI